MKGASGYRGGDGAIVWDVGFSEQQCGGDAGQRGAMDAVHSGEARGEGGSG